MDRVSWPWKKKSSDKASAEMNVAEASESPTAFKHVTQANYSQISIETYSHLTALEEQIQTLDDQILELKQKLGEAQSELETKDNLVKQHAKVAEEAVSGWEKAEAEALSLKNHLETVTLMKLATEDRATHLDDALKECMRQTRNLKDEHEQKLQEVVLAKTKQCENIKNELEARIGEFEQQLLQCAVDNSALTRSLQESSNMLMKITKEKSQAEVEMEHLKDNVESCEREINSLKYELHVVSKEVEIRNEEKHMSMKSAEVANKQHMEGVKKITKLEAECQRLRGLVRKKLPGPASIAQMKMEVENLGRDSGEFRLRRSPVTEFSFDNSLKYQKENEFLTIRLLTMEGETTLLKEALAERNSELQTSRSMFSKTLTKLQSLEAQVQTTRDGFYASNPPNLTSISEDGNDDEKNCIDSGPAVLISKLSQVPGKDDIEESRKTRNTSNLELMEDFLEMEKLACLGNPPEDINASVNSCDDPITSEEIATEKGSVESAISSIRDFVLYLGKELLSVHDISPDGDVMIQKIKDFCNPYNQVMGENVNLLQFILDLSCVLSDAGNFSFNSLGYKGMEADSNSPDCIDKVALPQNKLVQEEPSKGEIHRNDCTHISNPEVPDDGTLVTGFESNKTCYVSLEEFEELKLEKDKKETEVAKCMENLETTKSQLQEIQLQLASAQRSNSLAEIQLKCMAESYRTIETGSQELHNEISILKVKIETLENEMEHEKRAHEDVLSKCKELEKQLQRHESPAEDASKRNQERVLDSAAEQLAECQETILLLGKQLKAFRPQAEVLRSSNRDRTQSDGGFPEEESTISGLNFKDMDPEDIENAMTFYLQRKGDQSPLNSYNYPSSPLNIEAKLSPSRHPKHRPTKSTSSSPSATLTPGKHSRGFSRFFSSKSKNGN